MDNILLEFDLTDIKVVLESLITEDEVEIAALADDYNGDETIWIPRVVDERQRLIAIAMKIHEIVENAYARARRLETARPGDSDMMEV